MTDMPDNFKDFPRSVAEITAGRAHRGDLWTPRDALISLLREIDNGEKNPTDMVIAYQQPSKKREGAHSTHLVASCHSINIALGLLARAEFFINHDD